MASAPWVSTQAAAAAPLTPSSRLKRRASSRRTVSLFRFYYLKQLPFNIIYFNYNPHFLNTAAVSRQPK